MDFAHAPLLFTSKTYPLLMRLPWSGGSPTHSAAHPWPFMAWTAFLFLIPHSLLLSRAGSCLIVGFSSFSLFFTPSIILLPLFAIPLLLFLPWCYLTCACWASLGLLPILLPMTQYGHWFYTHVTLGFSWHILLLLGSFIQFLSSWPSLTHLLSLGIFDPFSNSAYPWAFTNSLRLL